MEIRFRRTLTGIALLVLVGASGTLLWQRSTRAVPNETPGGDGAAAQARTPVVVAPVKRRDLEDALVLSAEFRPFQEVSLYARVAGYVRQMRVDVGTRVKAGQVLAVLEIPELQDDLQHAAATVERAQGEVERAKAVYDEAHLTYERLAQVSKEQPNLIAQQEIDQARAREVSSRAAWQAAQSGVREASATRAKFGTLVRYSQIVAPFDGVVTRRLADTGSLVGAGTSAGGQAIVRVSQVDPLRLVLPVPESAVSRFHTGMPVDVLVQSTGRKITGHVARLSGEVSTDTRTMRVEVDVPNAALDLAPGMYASANAIQSSRNNVLSIPIEAVPSRKNGSASVLVAGKDDRLQTREIKLGMETAMLVEVTEGLGEGERVVIGGRGLRAGQLVRAKPIAEERHQ